MIIAEKVYRESMQLFLSFPAAVYISLYQLPYIFLFTSCHINCLSKVAVTSNVQLVSQLSDNCEATFTWRLQKKSGTNYGSYITLDYTVTETGLKLSQYIMLISYSFHLKFKN